MARSKSRPQRWRDAVAEAQKHIAAAVDAKNSAVEAFQELESIRTEYEEWKDNLPENLSGSPLADKLDEVCNLDFTSEDLDEMESTISDAEQIELPRGWGRD